MVLSRGGLVAMVVFGGCARPQYAAAPPEPSAPWPDSDEMAPFPPPPPPEPGDTTACKDAAPALKLDDALVRPGDACPVLPSEGDASYRVEGGPTTFWIRLEAQAWDAAFVDCSGGTITAITIYAPSLAPPCLAPLLDPRMGVAWRDTVATEFGSEPGDPREPNVVAASAPRGMRLYVVPGPNGSVPVLRLVRPHLPVSDG
ncbi:hypothetical protein [Nannocystis punicea]|uniref:Uncharacterized protein n=1 Tax=Nannocystis punicea TaxID=2995304 RepID=A0ABY7H8Z5_9BACT|nr:hypothetical protein [Nannocystis poenicansa]WAS95744.1 hypothetical protein O0S08_06240 [Nannocystis poenicansa]